MKASIDLQRSDLIRITLLMFPRHPANRNVLLGMAACITLFQVWQTPWMTHSSLLLALLIGLLAGSAGLLMGLLFQLVQVYWAAGRQPGVLGRHEFELTDTGVIERTEVNEGLANWASVQVVLVLKHYLLLQTGGGLHVLPRRSFESSVDFDAFCSEVQRLRKAAGSSGEAPNSRWLPLTGLALLVLLALLWQGGGEQDVLEQALAAEEQSYSQREAELLAALKIEHYREVQNGSRLLVLGSLHNTGSLQASSIRLEVELFDADGRFVYECSEYISRDLAPGERENFQVNCGCGKNAAPEHASLTVRVVSASNYD